MDQRSPREQVVPGLRPEAQPYEWKDLTNDQRKLVEDIHEYLVKFTGVQIPTSGKPNGPFSWLIDHRRPSNVILIDGGRGSGKTSVMLTAYHLWRQASMGQLPQEGEDDWQALRTQLTGSLAKKLIPLEVVDLQPLPPSTTLLPWLAGRLIQFIESLCAPESDGMRINPPAPIASWHPGWESQPESKKAWQELMRDAAAGWSGDLAKRKGALDPEAYAVELEQTERARLSTAEKWRDFVHKVVADAHKRQPNLFAEDARLILPIDDADMNPSRCVELLELLRALWHPQLVFLLTGDSELFTKTLHLHYLGEFRRHVDVGTSTEEDRKLIDQEPSARTLAWNVYDKVIPPAQRFLLNPLKGSERLLLLDDLLQAPAHRGNRSPPPAKLSEYFELDPNLQFALPDRLRPLQDLRQRWAKPPLPNAAAIVVGMWQDAVESEPVGVSVKRRLKQLVTYDEHSRNIQIIEPISVTWTSHPSHGLKETRLGWRLKFSLRTEFSFSNLDEIKTNTRLQALLLLALNLTEDSDQSTDLIHGPPSGFDNPLIVSEPGISDFPKAKFNWPLPDWRAPLDFALFAKGWKQEISSARDLELLAKSLKLFWLGPLALHDRRVMPQVTVFENMEDVRTVLGKLVDEANKLRSQTDQRSRILRNWILGRALLITAPEYGLPVDFANAYLAEWHNLVQAHEELMNEWLHALRETRREIILRQTKNRAAVFSQKIDAQYPKHTWHTIVEQHSTINLRLGELLGKSLQGIEVIYPPYSLVKRPANLLEYVNALDLVWASSESVSMARFKKIVANVNDYTAGRGVA